MPRCPQKPRGVFQEIKWSRKIGDGRARVQRRTSRSREAFCENLNRFQPERTLALKVITDCVIVHAQTGR